MFGLPLLLAALAAPTNPQPAVLSEFKRTCFPSRSLSALKQALVERGWTQFSSPAQSKLAREIAGVTTMLEAQGLASDYTIFQRNVGGSHLELAVSETRQPLDGGHKLIGCSIYDFDATSSVQVELLDGLVAGVMGQKSAIGDVSAEKWNNVFGTGTGMRAFFVPASSPMKDHLGFTGMMLGTHFLDGAK